MWKYLEEFEGFHQPADLILQREENGSMALPGGCQFFIFFDLAEVGLVHLLTDQIRLDYRLEQ